MVNRRIVNIDLDRLGTKSKYWIGFGNRLDQDEIVWD